MTENSTRKKIKRCCCFLLLLLLLLGVCGCGAKQEENAEEIESIGT